MATKHGENKEADDVTDDELSKLATNVIPADRARPFVLQYLKLTNDEYSSIVYQADNVHHDAMVECFKRWKHKQTMMNGSDLRQKLVQLLTKAREDYGWFSNLSYAFLDDTSLSDEVSATEALSETS